MADKNFTLDMTIAQAMQVHPRAAEVFAAFHLGGCAHCHINQVETLDNVCMAYGLEPSELLDALEGLMEPSKA
ncbi:MAG: DUF1858 domain-containing protein [Candidatus Hydrogenedentes bacterium]|nr:DUF1858 domain-containing protein [Candidatus Hydrogenedentota bacterium]